MLFLPTLPPAPMSTTIAHEGISRPTLPKCKQPKERECTTMYASVEDPKPTKDYRGSGRWVPSIYNALV